MRTNKFFSAGLWYLLFWRSGFIGFERGLNLCKIRWMIWQIGRMRGLIHLIDFLKGSHFSSR
ncbi:hypothetical protein CRP01_22480 [Flavilitoribacter nigricans DSM 23189 = NBRC 102662]|uniref:Uncharacterized protein n=1 Tax=Flavilitoribacter nigricans (strain ATCC 23147 / DSM 23189 / NBRC 102662 / NCIMB 1420 / SS-2) TaxID=1122177 RepID=A0A2D0N742_FLAN2|nr:hypothetical protein CRP01_22480 [Flavilitoribacter nigricans DSM 23189 = NBRC 102662]